MYKKIGSFSVFLIVISFLFINLIKAQEITIGSQEEWLENLKEWTDIMVEDGDWYYSNNNNKTSYQDARLASKHTSNCALMVVHALQRFGAFAENNKIWADDYGNLVYRPDNSNITQERLKAVANVTTYNGKDPDEVDLEPGDIVYYNGHVNVYLGVENKVRKYYDAGRSTTNTGAENGVWSSFIKKSDDLGHKIYGVIRLKYGQTVEVEGSSDEEHVYNGTTEDAYENGFISKVNSNNNFTCHTVFLNADGSNTEFKNILDSLFSIMQFLAPTIAIALTIIDYIKSIANGDTKKANSRTIKRIVIAVIIVFLPLLLDLLFHVFGLYDLSTCEIGR